MLVACPGIRIIKIAIILLFVVLTLGCASKSDTSASVYVEDGLSAATAVILSSGSIKEGVAAEDEWLQKHYPGFRRCSEHTTRASSRTEIEEIVHFAHHINIVGGRIISVLCVVLSDGEKREFYFDITACYNAQK